jgi:hypothetical protein
MKMMANFILFKDILSSFQKRLWRVREWPVKSPEETYESFLRIEAGGISISVVAKHSRSW